MTAHVSDAKKKVVKKLVELINKYNVIGAVNMEGLPAPQLQKMRSQLRGKVDLLMTKRRLITIAIEKAKDKKPGLENLVPNLKGMPALIFTNENPFSLFKTLKKSKSPAPAKAGQIAPKDIVIPAGPTSFMPGPIIGELGMLGIKTGVENGKVAVKQDATVAKEGEEISQKVAELLARFNILPMEVGLNITATYENGVIFDKKVLDIDEDKFTADMSNAARWAFNLAVYSGYPNKDTIKPLIAKAFREAKALGVSQNIIDEGIIDELLGKAERQMLGVKNTANIEVPEKATKPKEESKPEAPAPKVEEKKEEKAVEVKPQTQPEVKKETPVVEKKDEPIVEKKDQPIVEKKEETKTEDKVAKMVEQTKKKATGTEPTADKILDEVTKENPKPKKVEKKEEKVPSAHELAQQKEKRNAEQKDVENLAQELLKKGTLRR